MKTTTTEKRAIRLMRVAPCNWEKRVNKIPRAELHDLRRTLDGIALRAVELGAYVGMRENYGCIDRGHEIAWKESRKKGKQVWVKVLGYCAY